MEDPMKTIEDKYMSENLYEEEEKFITNKKILELELTRYMDREGEKKTWTKSMG